MPPPITERQLEILARTAELVAEQGLANLTLKKVAERVGFTEPAIYRHFESKQALISALVDGLGQRLLGTIREIAERRELAPAERLRGMVRHHVAVMRASRGLPLLLLAEGLASGDARLVERLKSVMRSYLAILTGVLAELHLPLPVAAERQAILFLGLPAALGLQLRIYPEFDLADGEVDALVRFFVDALAAPGPARESP